MSLSKTNFYKFHQSPLALCEKYYNAIVRSVQIFFSGLLTWLGILLEKIKPTGMKKFDFQNRFLTELLALNGLSSLPGT